MMARCSRRPAIPRQPLAGAASSQALLVPPCHQKCHSRHDSTDSRVQEHMHENRTNGHLAAPFLLLSLPTYVTHRSSNGEFGAKHVPPRIENSAAKLTVRLSTSRRAQPGIGRLELHPVGPASLGHQVAPDGTPKGT